MALPPELVAKALATVGERPFGRLTWKEAYERGLVDEAELVRLYAGSIEPLAVADAILAKKARNL